MEKLAYKVSEWTEVLSGKLWTVEVGVGPRTGVDLRIPRVELERFLSKAGSVAEPTCAYCGDPICSSVEVHSTDNGPICDSCRRYRPSPPEPLPPFPGADDPMAND
jgi:hypothetical protein